VASFGGWGSEAGQLGEPQDLAVDSEGNVYVVEAANNRLQVFDSQGHPLCCVTKLNNGLGELNAPAAIAVDVHNNVYVGDTKNHRILRMEWR